ncbi:MAG: hydrolase [Clostridiaceae bacterium]|jgi:nicotinamidase-related amidase|nr:hydrolase [Clostridiaceae bacterium]
MRNYKKVLLDPEDCVLMLVDHQAQMYFGIEAKTRGAVMNAAQGLARTAAIFKVPVVMTTVTASTFAGPMYEEILNVFPGHTPIDRTTLNAWEDVRVKKAVASTGRKNIIIAGLWTEVCVTFPALSALSDGYDVFVVSDACAGSSKEAHDMAMQRIIQAGATPITWQALLLEFQRDWANKETYSPVTALIEECGGAYGLGLKYVQQMMPSRANQSN